MGNKALSLSSVGNYEYGYGLAHKIAIEQLTRADIKQQCVNSGAQYIDSERVVAIEYLNQTYRVTIPEVEISLVDSEAEVPLKDRILILHYLAQAKGTPPSNRIIAYKELPEGANYFPTFAKRAIKPLVDHFGSQPQRLLDIAGILGGRKADYGDVAVTIDAFKRVPITFVLWRGDDEFPPEGNVVFDSNISDYLSTEDINVLCEAIAWRLVKRLKAGGDTHNRS